jgi:hypothetical protein
MKDMVKRPQQRYDALFRELRMHNEAPNNNASTSRSTDANDANDANDASVTMKTELKRYLMELNASSAAPAAEPQSHSLSNSTFIELGSVFQ